MAQRGGLSRSTIGRIWRKFDLKPQLTGTFKLSSDPFFVEKIDLFAAYGIADGTVISSLCRRHRAAEFKKFLTRIDKNVPAGLEVHMICDNLATHKTAVIQDWLARHPGSACTSRRPARPGSTRSSDGSAT